MTLEEWMVFFDDGIIPFVSIHLYNIYIFFL